jgi:hypothetical protein
MTAAGSSESLIDLLICQITGHHNLALSCYPLSNLKCDILIGCPCHDTGTKLEVMSILEMLYFNVILCITQCVIIVSIYTKTHIDIRQQELAKGARQQKEEKDSFSTNLILILIQILTSPKPNL